MSDLPPQAAATAFDGAGEVPMPRGMSDLPPQAAATAFDGAGEATYAP